MSEKKQGIVKYSTLLAVLVCVGKVLGFIKQSVIAWAYGANSTTDIFFAADGYTSTIAQIISASVAPTVLTSYILIKNKGRENDANKLVSNSLAFFSLISVILMILSIVFSEQIARVIGISYSGDERKLLSSFIIELSVVILFSSISGVMQGYLNANNRYAPGRLASLFYSIFSIVVIVTLKDFLGVRALIVGFLTGFLLHTVYIVFCGRKVISLPTASIFASRDFKDMLKKFLPLLISMSIVDFGHLIDKIVASSLKEGSISVLNYGQVISSDLVNAVVITTVGTVLLTSFTDSITKGEKQETVTQGIQNILSKMCVIVVLLTALFFVEGSDLIEVVLQRGSFNANNTIDVSSVAFFYSIGFAFMVIREILVKAHYAYQDMKAPVINSAAGVVINLVLSILLSKVLGVSGIALATSVSLVIVSILSVITLKKHIGRYVVNKDVLIDIGKIVIQGISAAGVGYLLCRTMNDMNHFIRMIIVGISMCVVYLCAGLILQEKSEKELLKVGSQIIAKLKRRS